MPAPRGHRGGQTAPPCLHPRALRGGGRMASRAGLPARVRKITAVGQRDRTPFSRTASYSANSPAIAVR
jgi:hypothetical protein